MPKNLAATMREATRLTGAGRLGDAARLIQGTLAPGMAGASRAPGDHPGRKVGPEEGKLASEAIDISNRLTKMFQSFPLSKSVETKLKRPLGETIRLMIQVGLAKLPVVNRQRAQKLIRVQPGAEFLSRDYSSVVGARSYKLFVPSRIATDAGLIVMLHGCTQNASDFAIGTRMNELAEEHGLIVAYPIQSPAANSLSCWNWFRQEDQIRGIGEPAIIAGLTEELVGEFEINRRRVFVAGLSAGGAMAAILGTIYADLYSAIGVHSGLNYGAASDLISAVAAMRRKRMVSTASSGRVVGPLTRTIVFHGDADRTVQPSNGDVIVAAAQVQLESAGKEMKLGRTAGGVDYSRTIIRDAQGAVAIEHWLLHGVGHAWSGGSAEGSYTDERGPDASREMVRFFLEAS